MERTTRATGWPGDPTGDIAVVEPASTASLRHRGVAVLLVGALAVATAIGLARFGYAMVLVPMREGLHLTDTQAGLLGSADLLGYLLATLPASALSARFGLRPLLGTSLAWIGGTMMLTALAPGFGVALLLRFLTGVGGAVANVAAMSIAGSWVAPSWRGQAAGVLVGGSGLALVASGALVPRMVLAFSDTGWRYAWAAFGVVALAVAVAGVLIVRNTPAELSLKPLGAGAGAPDVVLRPNARPAHASSWRAIYRSPALWRLGAVYAVWGFAYVAYTTFFARYLTSALGYAVADAGALWALVGACSLFCGVLWGLVADRIGRRAALVGVFTLQGAAILAFLAAPSVPSIVPVSAVLFGLTAWSVPGLMAALAADTCGPRLAGAGFGFITFLFATGQTLGPSAAGAIADVAGSLAPAFTLSGALLLVCALASLRLPLHGVTLHPDAAP